MKIRNMVVTLLVACSCFLTSVSASETPEIIVTAKEENKAQLQIKGIGNVNAFSLNLKLTGDGELSGLEPSDAMISQGAKVNYRYHQETKELDIYVTSKQSFTYEQTLDVADIYFTTSKDTLMNVTMNEEKAGLTTVNKTTKTNEMEAILSADPIAIKSESKDPDEEEQPKVENITLQDQTTGIVLEATSDVIAKQTSMKVQQISDETQLYDFKQQLKEVSSTFTAYEISLWDGTTQIQPKGKVRISMPLLAGYDPDQIAIYQIKNELQIFDITIQDHMVMFETDDLDGVFALTKKDPKQIIVEEDEMQNGSQGEDGQKQPSTDQKGTDTGDHSNRSLYLTLLLISAGCLSFIGYKKYKKHS